LNSEQQFNDLMRNLRFLLRNDFFSLHELIETETLYERESSALQGLVKGMDAQLQSGNISLKENIRVKSLLYSLRSEQADLQTRMEDLQKDLRMLLQVSADTSIVPSQSANSDFHPEALTLQQLMDSARTNRPDLQVAKTNLLMQQHNLAYQKALAVPDLTLAVEYDQRSSYINNYYGLGISLPIPLLNTNKGNIRAAAISGKQAETQVLQVQQQAALEVAGAYNKLLINTKLSEEQPIDLAQNYERLLSNMLSSYAQRQVGLLEFIDFFDAYKDARTRELHLDNSLRSAAAELDFTIGIDLINLQ
jgi:cobalt-zinc-cadmium efflux system outer membrane protein